MPKRKFAEGTSVPVAKSKEDIAKLLREWGADRVAWQEDFKKGDIFLGFVWTKDDKQYGCRLHVSLRTEKAVREDPDNLDRRTGDVNENRVREALNRAGRSELRLLLLWLKAAFNAIDAGIVDAETLFLPFFITGNGETVADVVMPNLPSLVQGNFDMKRLKA